MIDEEELRRLAQAATPGTWGNTDVSDPTRVNSPYDQVAICYRTSRAISNAKFIAAANPAAIIELLDEIELLRTQRDEHKADWLEALALAEQASPILARQQAEIERLRAVFSAARAVIRYDGVDADKCTAAMIAMDKAVQAVLVKDQGGERC